MDIYVMNTGSTLFLDFMEKNNLRRMFTTWRNPKKFKYALDNGAFGCWKRGETFNANAFTKLLERSDSYDYGPDFVVCPDIVAGGKGSLQFSLEWMEKLPRDDYYLAVQDGMIEGHIINVLDRFKGIFVGGTMEWKLLTGETWAQFAHSYGLKCHIGRVGTFKRLLWARRIGADSVDSSTFAWCKDLSRFKRIIAMSNQTCFSGPCTGDKYECNGCALPHFDFCGLDGGDA